MKYVSFTKFFLFTLFSFILQGKIVAQTNEENQLNPAKDTIYIITTNDGGEFIGKIISDDGREVVIMTDKKGKLILPKYVIKSLDIVDKTNMIGNVAVLPNPHPSRYLFAPSAFPLKKGEGYINAFYFLVWQAQYGITDNFSLGVTTSWILAPTFLNAKYTIPLGDKLNMAIGGQIGKLYIADENPVTLGFSTLTYGTPESNVSVNVGYGSYEKDGMFIATISGNQRIGKSASLMGEFWYCQPNGADPFVMGGPALRIYSGRKATFDIALTALAFKERRFKDYNFNTDEYTYEYRWNAYYPIPMLSISYKL